MNIDDLNTKCQVFTPSNYVNVLLDSIKYKNDLYGKKILENSCGDGNILCVVVQRYIGDCRKKHMSDEEIRKGIKNDIYGVEIDPIQFKKCVKNLNDIAEQNNLQGVEWNIINQDYLKWTTSLKFQFLVGNPPYITYQELKSEERKFVKDNFESCKRGKFDYCYAFIERSLEHLDENGKMSYLIPSSVFKTVFGEAIREKIKPYVARIIDYTKIQVFDNALVKSAIMVLCKRPLETNFSYCDIGNKGEIKISRSKLDKKWIFTDEGTTMGLNRFGDYYKVSHVVATLCNEVFVLREGSYEEVEAGYRCGEMFVERDLVRETATPRTLRYGKQEKIVFPYNYENNRLVHYDENVFQKKFPRGMEYLKTHKKKLDDRKADDTAEWFEYGRSQALAGLNQEKLLISTVVTEKLTGYLLSSECIPYAGMYVVPRNADKKYTLVYAKQLLESAEFAKYANDVGVHISGESVRLTSKDIENFRF